MFSSYVWTLTIIDMKKIFVIISILAAVAGCNKPDTDDTRFYEENLKATVDHINVEVSLNAISNFYIACQLNDVLSGKETVYAEMFTEVSQDKWYSNLLNISFETGGKLLDADGAEWNAGHWMRYEYSGDKCWKLSYQNGGMSYDVNLTLLEDSKDIFEVTISGNGEYIDNNVITRFEIEDVTIKRQFVDNVLVRTTSAGVIKGDFYDPEDNDISRAFCELHLGSVPEYITGYNLTE